MAEKIRSAELATTNAYQEVARIDTIGFHRVSVELDNTGANGAHVKVELSIIGEKWSESVAEQAVAAGAAVHIAVPAEDEPFKKFRVMAKSQVADAPTDVRGHIYAK